MKPQHRWVQPWHPAGSDELWGPSGEKTTRELRGGPLFWKPVCFDSLWKVRDAFLKCLPRGTRFKPVLDFRSRKSALGFSSSLPQRGHIHLECNSCYQWGWPSLQSCSSRDWEVLGCGRKAKALEVPFVHCFIYSQLSHHPGTFLFTMPCKSLHRTGTSAPQPPTEKFISIYL